MRIFIAFITVWALGASIPALPQTVYSGPKASTLTTGSPPANTPNPTYTLRAQRNVVIVRVIVRDRNGKAVAGLHKEDFRLFDDKGPQTIDGFSVDSPGVKASPVASSPRVPPAAAAPAPAATRPVIAPDRFLALYFDDVYLPFEDAVYIRNPAKKFLANSLRPSDRAAVFTSSGHLSQDFTSNRDKLTQVIDKLLPRPVIFGIMPCNGELSPDEAYFIRDMQSPEAFADAAAVCGIAGDQRGTPRQHIQTEIEADEVLDGQGPRSRPRSGPSSRGACAN